MPAAVSGMFLQDGAFAGGLQTLRLWNFALLEKTALSECSEFAVFSQAPLAKSQSLRVSWPPKPRHPGGTSPARRRARDRPFIKKENSYVTKFKNRKSHRQIPHHPRRRASAQSSPSPAPAQAGGIGVISAAQPGWRDPEFARDPLSANLRALAFHIRRAKEISNGGIIGVNIMCALTHYEEYVRCCIENGADLIISGAGLPTDLPKYTAGSSIKLAPIVSPPRTAKVLLKLWDNHYHRVPDLVVIEGPAAGGHLGYSAETVEETARRGYDDEIREILQIVHGYEEKYACTIPVVFAGGVYTHEDILHYLSLGCAGVQMATRFVVTEECDADPRYKQAYLNAKKEDITIMHSPVGMPGRAIRNPFLTEREQEREKISHCYQCLKKCDKVSIPYCITTALARAADGDTDNALLFCGENAWRLDHMTTVPELMAELVGESLPDSKK